MKPGALQSTVPLQQRSTSGESDEGLHIRIRFFQVRKIVAKESLIVIAEVVIQACGSLMLSYGKGEQTTIFFKLTDNERVQWTGSRVHRQGSAEDGGTRGSRQESNRIGGRSAQLCCNRSPHRAAQARNQSAIALGGQPPIDQLLA